MSRWSLRKTSVWSERSNCFCNALGLDTTDMHTATFDRVGDSIIHLFRVIVCQAAKMRDLSSSLEYQYCRASISSGYVLQSLRFLVE